MMKQYAEKIHQNQLTIENLPSKHLAIEINIRQVLDNLQLKSSVEHMSTLYIDSENSFK